MKAQYIYNIGYGTYEESSRVQMYHDKKLSKLDLHRRVVAAIIRVLERIAEGEISSADLSFMEEGPSFQKMMKHVIVELKKDGFREVEFEASWSAFGWPSLTDNKNWKGQRNGLDEITNAIPLGLRRKINNIGKENRRKFDEMIEKKSKQYGLKP